MQESWPTKLPDLQYSPNEWDPKTGTLKWPGSLTHWSTNRKQLVQLRHNQSFYADDSAFIFLSLEDLIIGTKHVRDHFKQFGLQIHLGTRSTMPGVQDIKSKMEAMYFPPYEMRKAEIPENLRTGSYDIGDGQFVSFCQAFWYLGTFLTPTLDDNFDIDSRITAATKAFYSMHNILLNKRIKLIFMFSSI